MKRFSLVIKISLLIIGGLFLFSTLGGPYLEKVPSLSFLYRCYFLTVLVLSAFLLIIFLNPKGAFFGKRGEHSFFRIRDRNIFLLILLFSVLIAITATTTGGHIGADGMYYYSYVRSMFIDHDLHFDNEYQIFGIADRPYLKWRSPTGHLRNIYAFGPAFLWIPFFLLGMGVAKFLALLGAVVPLDGFSYPYAMGVHLGSLTYGFFGILLIYEVLKDFFEKKTAIITAFALTLGTQIFWYLVGQPHMPHACSLFAVTLFLYLWYRGRGRRSFKNWLLMGIAGGLMTMVRYQTGFFMIVPAIDSLLYYFEYLKRREFVATKKLFWGNLIFLGGFLLGASPQMIVWKIIYGVPYIGNPYGGSFLRWGSPRVLEVLFSSRHGLLSWTPLIYLALIGIFLFYPRDRKLTLLLAIPFLGMLWVNSAATNWWAGGSFGDRRFICSSLFFAIGLASFIEALIRFIRKRSTEIAFTIIVLFMLSNILLATLFATFVIPRESSVSFSFLAGRKIGLLYRFIGYPFSFPLTLYFSLKTGLSPARCDLLFGNWLLQPGKRFGRARIDFGKNDRIFLGDGWSYPERWDGKIPFRWSCGEKSTLFFYLDKGEPLQMVVNAAPFVHPKMPKQMLFISVNGKKLPPITLAEGFNNYAFNLGEGIFHYGINRVDFTYKWVSSPKELGMSEDKRRIAVAFNFLELARKGRK
ncbi:MAG: glycosyltransferase family 39 protein [Acidobacteria bacterium]|nr:glycosyltransferase family 39 protein [Acidobacteriota bacterium]